MAASIPRVEITAALAVRRVWLLERVAVSSRFERLEDEERNNLTLHNGAAHVNH
jgi:hypothetical protein